MGLLLSLSVLFILAAFLSWRANLALIGKWLRWRMRDRRQAVLSKGRVNRERVQGGDESVIGFFHPFCHAAGGGERVLWAAVRATQEQWPWVVCVIYTGGEDTGNTIMDRVEFNFNIYLDRSRMHFVLLKSREWVRASRYPYFTLLGQSLGSLRVGYDAFSQMVPDVFIDTMGYSFVTALASLLFPDMPTAAYVHYPTISTDMLGSLDADSTKGLNAGKGKGLRGFVKRYYWRLFARLYGWTGGQVDLVMTNSSWTQGHILKLWGRARARTGKKTPIEVLYPPVSVSEIEKAVTIDQDSEAKREKILLCIAQFRPEKNHEILLDSFSEMLRLPLAKKDLPSAKLVLIGSIRDDNAEDQNRVNYLRQRAKELGIEEKVLFLCNAPWQQMVEYLGKSSVGVNGMWNEHFGIGVVEYQAAGLICVVNNSGGPKMDIVVDIAGGPTGFHASTASEYAKAFEKALLIPPKQALQMRSRARASAGRFSEEKFQERWAESVGKIIEIKGV